MRYLSLDTSGASERINESLIINYAHKAMRRCLSVSLTYYSVLSV